MIQLKQYPKYQSDLKPYVSQVLTNFNKNKYFFSLFKYCENLLNQVLKKIVGSLGQSFVAFQMVFTVIVQENN